MHSENFNTLPSALHELLPAELQRLATHKPVQRGDQLFRQRSKPSQMFFVAHGEVVLQRLGIQGETVVLQRVQQGFVAEASLQSPRYHCEAVMTSSGSLIAIPMDALRKTLQHDVLFATRWISMLNQELKRLRTQCERLSLVGIKDRVTHLIETEGKDGRLILRASLKSIAAEIGVTHEALYRTLAAMEKEGLLQRTAAELHIRRPTIL
ncbi:MAG: Crp/Fnr family transcriptional regulator [Pseudomonadota bacterium]